ncbi:MAG: metallophosphoesterase, partial [Aureliella sp.]
AGDCRPTVRPPTFRAATLKIHILSDLHLEFRAFELPHVDADVRVLAGDIHTKCQGTSFAAESARQMATIYIAGNHEFYGTAIPKLYDQLLTTSNDCGFHFLQNEQAVIGSVRFLGCTLWTDFGLHGDDDRGLAMLTAQNHMSDYRRIRVSPQYRKLTPTLTYSFHRASLAWLERCLSTPFDGRTVVVTHHAPSATSVADKVLADPISASYASNLDDFIQRHPIDLWIHGHTHRCADYRIGQTRIISNQRGYPGEDTGGFDAGLVVEL